MPINLKGAIQLTRFCDPQEEASVGGAAMTPAAFPMSPALWRSRRPATERDESIYTRPRDGAAYLRNDLDLALGVAKKWVGAVKDPKRQDGMSCPIRPM